jgi:hypothetical protein
MRLNRAQRAKIRQRAEAKLEAADDKDKIDLKADEMIEMTVSSESLTQQVENLVQKTSGLLVGEDKGLKNVQKALAALFEEMMLQITKSAECQCPFCMAEGFVISGTLINMRLIMEDGTSHNREALPTLQLMLCIASNTMNILKCLKSARAKPIIIGTGGMSGLVSALLQSGGRISPEICKDTSPPSEAELREPHRNIVEVLGRVPHPAKEGQDVMLLKTGPNRIAVIRLIRQLTGAGIKESLAVVDSKEPARVCTVEYPEEAMAIVYALERIGASANYQKTPV